MKVLIITYYWPPSGGSGVQRWLKFVKYFRDFGVEPVVFTVDKGAYVHQDLSLMSDIPEGLKLIRQPIWEPYHLLGIFQKKRTTQQDGFLKKSNTVFGRLAAFVRANIFIPDARMFWIRPSVKRLLKELKTHPVDCIITTGPPHSCHLIGYQLKQKLDLKWVADFRDPWTSIDYFHHLPMLSWVKKWHHNLEKRVLKNADATLVVGNEMKKQYQRTTSKIHVVSNGYDYSSSVTSRLDEVFSITHLGMLNADRNPIVLWQVIAELIKEDKEFAQAVQINLIGKVAEEVIKDIQQYKLASVVNIKPYIPHEEVLSLQKNSQVLLLVVNNVPFKKGIVTGKVFEYLYAQRPIIGIGPEDGDMAHIVKEAGAGDVVDYHKKEELKHVLKSYFAKYQVGQLQVKNANPTRYHRKNITKELVEIIQKL